MDILIHTPPLCDEQDPPTGESVPLIEPVCAFIVLCLRGERDSSGSFGFGLREKTVDQHTASAFGLYGWGDSDRRQQSLFRRGSRARHYRETERDASKGKWMLKHMLKAGHGHLPEETIEDIAQPADTLLPAGAGLQAGLPAIAEDQVVLVREPDQPVGILTKIDILDFIAQRI